MHRVEGETGTRGYRAKAAPAKSAAKTCADRDPLAAFVPPSLNKITDPQTEIPKIAKDPTRVSAVEEAARAVTTQHQLHRGDAREMAFLPPESVHLVVTSPPYWTLKAYHAHDDQLGWIADYEEFLDQLDRVWQRLLRSPRSWWSRRLCRRRRLPFAPQEQRSSHGGAAARVDSRALSSDRFRQCRSDLLA